MWVRQKDYEVIGGVLMDARERAGLTQQDLARRLRKPQSFVSNYERGQRRIDVLELLRIIESLEDNPLRVFRQILTGFKAPATSR